MIQKTLVLAAILLAIFFGCQSSPETMDEKDSMESMDTMDSMESDGMAKTDYVITIEVSSMSHSPIAPVVWAVHRGANPFIAGDMGARLEGLESLAEDGNPEGLAASVGMLGDVTAHGVVAVPDGASEAGAAAPGHSYSFTVSVGEDEKVSFATMYVQSNDLFFSPGPEGLSFAMDMGDGDVTDHIILYDAGTEMNEAPGEGPNQAPRQSTPNTGMDEMGAVTPVMDIDDGFMYPATDSVLHVTVHAGM